MVPKNKKGEKMLFVKDKPSRVLLAIRENELYLSQIAKQTDTTYVYVTGFVHLLEKKGLAKIELKGKKKVAKLTEAGAEVAKLIDELIKKEKQISPAAAQTKQP